MSCVEYATGKWKCPVTFIHRDNLDPIIKEHGVQVFAKERWGATQNLYVRYNGAKAQYVVPDGFVIVGIAGKLAMLTDWIRDPSGGMKSQIFYRFSHFYIGNLKYINQYDKDYDEYGNPTSKNDWEASFQKVELPGNSELQQDWEFDTQTFDQLFVRGYFLTGMMMHQGALAPMSSGPIPINVAVVVQTKHYLKGKMKEYVFGDKRAGISKPAGLNIPDFRRTIAGIKYDASVIYFNPFFEVENMFVKDVWAELPADSYSTPDTGGTTTNTDTVNPEVPSKGDTTPVKTDTGSGGNTEPTSGTGGLGEQTGSGGSQTPSGTSNTPATPTTPNTPNTPNTTTTPTDGVHVDLSGGTSTVLPKNKTIVEKGLDFYNDNQQMVIIGLILLVLLFVMMPEDVPPPRRRYEERRSSRSRRPRNGR